MADLQQRLVPTGIASRFQGDDIFADSTRVAISNILYSEMLEVLPLPLPEHGCEPTPMRVRRVTIVGPPLIPACSLCHCHCWCFGPNTCFMPNPGYLCVKLSHFLSGH